MSKKDCWILSDSLVGHEKQSMSLANKLNIVYAAYVVMVDEYEQFLIPANQNLFNVIDLQKVKSIDITYVFRKNSNDSFKYYYQIMKIHDQFH